MTHQIESTQTLEAEINKAMKPFVHHLLYQMDQKHWSGSEQLAGYLSMHQRLNRILGGK